MKLDLTRSSVSGRRVKALLILALLVATASPALAVVLYDQTVTNAVIFGSGNANGGFTVDTAGGVEIGLRAKLRFDATNQPQDVYNSNGNGTYTFPAILPPSGFGFASGSPNTPIWNFDWSVNTDPAGGSGLLVDDLTYEMGIDFDPSTGTNFLVFDPISTPSTIPYTVPVPVDDWDHSFGTNATGSGAGAESTSPANYDVLAAANNLVQNSWNHEFYNDAAPFLGQIDPTVDGTYTIYLLARSGATVVARSEIRILSGAGGPDPVPASSTLSLIFIAVFLLTAVSLMAVGFRRQGSSLTPTM